MWHYLKETKFDTIVKGTLATAVVDDEEDLQKPSNALKLGIDLKRMINIKIVSIMNKDQQSQLEGENLLKVMDVFWSTRVTK